MYTSCSEQIEGKKTVRVVKKVKACSTRNQESALQMLMEDAATVSANAIVNLRVGLSSVLTGSSTVIITGGRSQIMNDSPY